MELQTLKKADRPGILGGSARQRIKNIGKGLTGALVVFAAWQFVFSLNLVNPMYFPSAWMVLTHCFVLLGEPSFLSQILVTLKSMFLGILIAALIGVPFGLLFGRFQVAYRMAKLLVETLRPIPAVALAPLAILLFGLSDRATTSLVVWTSLWPILINSVYGMHNVDEQQVQTARIFGFNRLETLVRVELPNCAPFIVTGIRISLSIALAVAISGEMVAGTGNGLGGWILKASAAGSMTPAYSTVVLSGFIGYGLNYLLEYAERKLFFWHASFRKS